VGSSVVIDDILDSLRRRGLRMTPQRRAIVTEILELHGHISAGEVAERVQKRIPGVNASTVYRTLALLEDVGVLSHAHFERGVEYHRSEDASHVHLVCAHCGAHDSLTTAEIKPLERLVRKHHGFLPDLTHFAISGTCRNCQTRAGG
jgi:Fur family transcriptional regulator, ferric uptake regulator